MRIIKIFVALVVLLFALIVLFQNTERVAFAILWWRVEAPALVMFAAMFIAGAVLGLTVPLFWRRLNERPKK